MPNVSENANALDRLDVALDIIEALQDGMFAPEYSSGKEPLIFYPQARLGMVALMDCLKDHITAAKGLVRAENSQDDPT